MYKTSNICDLEWVYKILVDLYDEGKISFAEYDSVIDLLIYKD